MVKHRAILHIGTLHTSPRRFPKDALLFKNSQGISLTLTEKDRFEELEQLFLQESKTSRSLYKLISWGLSIVSVTIILVAIVALSVYEDIAKQLLLQQRFTGDFADWFSLGLVLLVILGIALAPAIVSGESSQLHDILKSWFFHDLRKKRRLYKVINSWDQELPLHLYNVDILDKNHWFWRLLAPLFIAHFQVSHWHVRHDQAVVLKHWLTEQGIGKIELEQQTAGPVCAFLLDEPEQRLRKWMGDLALVHPVSKSYVTAKLVRCVARQLVSEEIANQTSVLIERMQTDFAHSMVDEQGRILFLGQTGAGDQSKNLLQMQLREHLEEILVLLDSPISLCCLHQLLDPILPLRDQVCVLERLLARIQATQQYDLILLYWLPMVGPMFSLDEDDEVRFSNDSIYHRLCPASLAILLALFERNGQFIEALKLATYLYPLNPLHYGITISSLQERLGNFEAAFSHLEQITLPPKDTAPQDVAIRLYQRRAWMVVSGRLERRKKQGKEALATLESLLVGHSDNNEPLWLWHYHNIKANYAEWDSDYETAISHYRQCLLVPALGDFEYGATFVNLAISQRLVFLTDPSQQESMQRATRNGAMGLYLKRRVGDRDEMPVVLHNQALNLLYAILYDVLPLERAEEPLLLAQEGLNIVEETGSLKRRAILAAEALLASTMLGQDNTVWKEKLQIYGPEAMEYEKEQIIFLHNIFLEKLNTTCFEKEWLDEHKVLQPAG